MPYAMVLLLLFMDATAQSSPGICHKAADCPVNAYCDEVTGECQDKTTSVTWGFATPSTYTAAATVDWLAITFYPTSVLGQGDTIRLAGMCDSAKGAVFLPNVDPVEVSIEGCVCTGSTSANKRLTVTIAGCTLAAHSDVAVNITSGLQDNPEYGIVTFDVLTSQDPVNLRNKYGYMIDAWMKLPQWVYGILGSMASVAIAVTAFAIALAWRSHSRRLAWMVTKLFLSIISYASGSLAALMLPEWAMFTTAVIGVWESWAVYTFPALIVAYFGNKRKLTEALVARANEGHPPKHIWGVQLIIPSINPERFVRQVMVGIRQYVLVALGDVLLIFVVFFAGSHDHVAENIVMLFRAFSRFVALYNLVLLHDAIHDLVHGFNVGPKVAALETVILGTYYQVVAVHIADYFWPKLLCGMNVDQLVACLMCAEMLPASLWFFWVFRPAAVAVVDRDKHPPIDASESTPTPDADVEMEEHLVPDEQKRRAVLGV